MIGVVEMEIATQLSGGGIAGEAAVVPLLLRGQEIDGHWGSFADWVAAEISSGPCGPSSVSSSPLPLELLLDVGVGEIEVDGRRLEPVVAQDLLHRRQADTLLQGRRGEGMPEHVRRHVLGDPRPVGDLLDEVLGSPFPDGEAFSKAKWCSSRARTRRDIGTTRTLVFLP